MLTACDRVSIVCRHDFLGILEPYMMEEKKGLVDFLRTAVGCFRDLPRGHIISLAQHMQQVLLFITLVCATLCCAVLCCAVLCCAVLDCSMLSCICYVYAVQYMPCSACCAVYAMLCMHAMLCCAILCIPSTLAAAFYCLFSKAFLKIWANIPAITLDHTKSRLVHCCLHSVPHQHVWPQAYCGFCTCAG